MVSQTLLPFQSEIDPTNSKLTALGGLPLFLDLMSSLGVIAGLRQCLTRSGDMQGWSVSDVVLSLMVRLHSDTAAYQKNLMKNCAEGRNEQFGVIEFALGTDVYEEFKKAVGEVSEADWTPLLRARRPERCSGW